MLIGYSNNWENLTFNVITMAHMGHLQFSNHHILFIYEFSLSTHLQDRGGSETRKWNVYYQ
jgi:hypothetical protein